MINGSIFHLPLADKSVHCIVFSPPYYGLRNYGLAPIVIGGELDCVHEWGSELSHRQRGKIGDKSTIGLSDENPKGRIQSTVNQGSFCLNCSAWRGSLGLEPTPELFIEHCRIYARECWRVLRDDGTMWVNIGASYASTASSDSPGSSMGKLSKEYQLFPSYKNSGYKPKDLIPTPWLFAIALQRDGWWLRSDIIWQKPNPMPESVIDRPTRSHEYVFLFSKSRQYFYDADAVREKSNTPFHSIGGYREGNIDNAYTPKEYRNKSLDRTGRNRRSVWTIPTHGFSEAHFATFPPALIEPMIKAGTSERGVCIECGSQFERVVSSSTVGGVGWERRGNISTGPRLGGSVNYDKYSRGNTLGFRPTCKHYDPLYYTHFPMARNKRKRYQQFKSGHWWKRVKKRPVPISWPTDKPIVLDPFGGAGTTELVSTDLGRLGVSIELSFDYCKMAMKRLKSKGKRTPPKLIKLIEQGQRQMFNEHKIEIKGDDLETLDQMTIEQLDIFKVGK